MSDARKTVMEISTKAKEECIAIAKKAFVDCRLVMRENPESFTNNDIIELNQVESLWLGIERDYK